MGSTKPQYVYKTKKAFSNEKAFFIPRIIYAYKNLLLSISNQLKIELQNMFSTS